MKLVLISDTHGKHYQLGDMPEGDVLVHAGDLSMNGGLSVYESLNTWLGELPYKHKVIIAGNHDLSLDSKHGSYKSHAKSIFSNAIYLEESSVVIDGIKFYGSPYTPAFGYGWAFNANEQPNPRPELPFMYDIAQRFPKYIDVLITHGPPAGILDYSMFGRTGAGSQTTMNRILEIKPKIHVFGHIHESYGDFVKNGTWFYNASVVNSRYEVVNKPWVVEI